MNTTDAPAAPELTWFKSSYSGAEGGQCLEFAAAPVRVYIRDSKQASGPVLTVGTSAWTGFVGLVTG
ncbi:MULTISPECIES: DUF397 domain-containing protein [unclassified Streptomyces]|uniref:DUF397 domain-containing protein n=1 Tax=unclassified Streptomyces TaxID=2593676 RepID=UPI002ED0AC70|nr:DUF397 domain-containing protein [Streptomyces sp. NBC_00891]WSY08881.1 DUF397 domain-containing protein [Streptomyces sp. NBC_00890]WSZ10504.1 DUF397 domain-containing protein [Streptomyces sp. NBC_00869]WSZ21993.1 DUF397 domain-containing protein [Streptomyces sp. NBC_00870]